MAASALRLGCKILQQDAWKLRVVYPTVSLCTKSGKPKKEPTKNVVVPEKKAQVQVDQYAPGSHLPAGNAGEAVTKTNPDAAPSGPEKGIVQFSARKTLVEVPLTAPSSAVDHTVGAVGAAGDQLKAKKTSQETSSSSSSSSSESNSSSSSDSEDEGTVLQVPVRTKVDFPTQGSCPAEESKAKQAVSKQQKTAAGTEKHSSDLKQKDSQKITKAAGSTAIPSVSRPTDAKAKSVISKPSLDGKSPTSGTRANDTTGGLGPIKTKVVKKGSKAAISQQRHGAKGGPPPSSDVRSPGTGPAQSLSGKVTQDSSLPGASNAEPEKTIQSEEAVLPLHAAAPKVPERSTTPDNTTGTEEPGTVETADPSMTPVTEADAAAQEQPFDNSTYRNLQHHSFTPFTFADIELELVKFRMPQPSSGRPSPRH